MEGSHLSKTSVVGRPMLPDADQMRGVRVAYSTSQICCSYLLVILLVICEFWFEGTLELTTLTSKNVHSKQPPQSHSYIRTGTIFCTCRAGGQLLTTERLQVGVPHTSLGIPLSADLHIRRLCSLLCLIVRKKLWILYGYILVLAGNTEESTSHSVCVRGIFYPKVGYYILGL